MIYNKGGMGTEAFLDFFDKVGGAPPLYVNSPITMLVWQKEMLINMSKMTQICEMPLCPKWNSKH